MELVNNLPPLGENDKEARHLHIVRRWCVVCNQRLQDDQEQAWVVE